MKRRIRLPGCVQSRRLHRGADGEHDWIVMDPDIDFREMMSEYDTAFMGRRTFEEMGGGWSGGMTTFVFSRTLRQEDHPGVTIVSDRIAEQIEQIRAAPGKDIWLFGGGDLFRSLPDLGLVDRVEPAIVPVLLGAAT